MIAIKVFPMNLFTSFPSTSTFYALPKAVPILVQAIAQNFPGYVRMNSSMRSLQV